MMKDIFHMQAIHSSVRKSSAEHISNRDSPESSSTTTTIILTSLPTVTELEDVINFLVKHGSISSCSMKRMYNGSKKAVAVFMTRSEACRVMELGKIVIKGSGVDVEWGAEVANRNIQYAHDERLEDEFGRQIQSNEVPSERTVEEIKDKEVERTKNFSARKKVDLSRLINSLSDRKKDVANGMMFCIYNSKYAEEITIILAVSIVEPSISTETAFRRLSLLSDILYNSQSGFALAWQYRISIEMVMKDIVSAFGLMWSNLGKMRAEVIRLRVLEMLDVWESWSIYGRALIDEWRRYLLQCIEGCIDAVPKRVGVQLSVPSPVLKTPVVEEEKFKESKANGFTVVEESGRPINILRTEEREKFEMKLGGKAKLPLIRSIAVDQSKIPVALAVPKLKRMQQIKSTISEVVYDDRIRLTFDPIDDGMALSEDEAEVQDTADSVQEVEMAAKVKIPEIESDDDMFA